MSTKGCYGFTKNGIDKITYNHFDSYPIHLGNVILDFICNTETNELNSIFDNLQVVEIDTTPNKEQVNEVVKIFGEKQVEDYLIRNMVFDKNDKDIKDKIQEYLTNGFGNLLTFFQGEPSYLKKGLKYIVNDISFMGNSLFCEYAYIINLDNNTLEFYLGFNKKDTGNRFSQYVDDSTGYKECKLAIAIPFDIIRENQKMCLDIMDFISEKSE